MENSNNRHTITTMENNQNDLKCMPRNGKTSFLNSYALHVKRLMTFIAITSTTINMWGQTPTPGTTVETRELKPFDLVYVSRGINVTIVEADQHKAEIHITNAPASDVIIEQKGRLLEIRMRARINTNVSVNVYIYMDELRKASAFTGASIFSEGVIKTDELILESATDGLIQLSVDVNRLVMNASASRMEIKGSARSGDITASAGARLLASNLEIRESQVRANSGANAQVHVTHGLTARAATGARIQYKGEPTVIDVHTSTGGRVEKF